MAMLLKARIEERFEVEVLVAHDLAQTQIILAQHAQDIKIALSDLNLPDAPNGESIHLLRQVGITTVVLTASYDEKLRQKILQERVADFVLKEGAAAIEYVLRVLNLLLTNDQREIWLANFSDRLARKIAGLLAIHRFKIRVFDHRKTLFKELEITSPNLLLIGDLDQDGKWFFALSDLRSRFEFYQLPVLACIEQQQGSPLALKYMKYGATDYIVQPFSAEELYARVNQNIDQQLAYQEIKHISQTDALSGLYNRRYCFEVGEHQYQAWLQQKHKVFAVLIDIDFFKRINDQFGHPKGDEAIQFTARQLKAAFKNNIVARFGGEEFIVIGDYQQREWVMTQAEAFRASIEQKSAPEIEVSFTVSIGVAFDIEPFENLISLADQKLYEAKDQGRNQVCVTD